MADRGVASRREYNGLVRTIFHVDMDAFFAAVEQRENPELAGRPVIVGADPQQGRGRGVVAACSYEARRFGIRSALPISRAYRLCPQGIYLRPNGKLYAEVSRQVMSILSRFTDRLEPISIDEAFLDVSGCERLHGAPLELAARVKGAVWAEQRLTCSIGIAANKFVAKVASDLKKPDGLVQVPAGTEEKFLRPLEIRRIWGVGPKTEQRLHQMGIYRIGDIAARPLDFWRRTLGLHGEQLWHLAQGRDERPVECSRAAQSISQETTFEADTQDLARIRQTLQVLSEQVARRLRDHQIEAATVTLKFRYGDFSTRTRRKSAAPTSDPQLIFRIVWRLFESFQPLQMKVRLLGVGVSRFSEASAAQPGLFDEAEEKQRRINAAMDAVAARFGSQAIGRAGRLAWRRDGGDC